MKALRVRKVALCALFICIAAVLSAVESFLPPICAIPGVRVGLGNIVTMFMLYIGGKWRSIDVMLVVILRCFVAAFITGQVMNLFYGVMGGICALGVMLLMRKLLPGDRHQSCRNGSRRAYRKRQPGENSAHGEAAHSAH